MVDTKYRGCTSIVDFVNSPYSVGMSIATVAMPPFWRSIKVRIFKFSHAMHCCYVVGC